MALPTWNEIATSPEWQQLDDQQKAKVFQGYTADMGQLPEWQELEQPQKMQVLEGMKQEAGIAAPVPEEPSFIQDVVVPTLETPVRAVAQTGAQVAQQLNEGIAGFAGRLDKVAQKMEADLGLSRGGLFEKAAEQYQANADYWDKKAADIGGENVVSEIIGAAAGGGVPGIAEFALGVPYAAMTGYGEGGAEGAVEEGAKRYLLGEIFKTFQGLKKTVAAPAMGTVMAAETAVAGGTPEEVAKSAGVGLLFGAAHAPGQRGFREVARDVKQAGVPTRDPVKEGMRQAEMVIEERAPSPAQEAASEFLKRDRGQRIIQEPVPGEPITVAEAPRPVTPEQLAGQRVAREAEAKPTRAEGEMPEATRDSLRSIANEIESFQGERKFVDGKYVTVFDGLYEQLPFLQSYQAKAGGKGVDRKAIAAAIKKGAEGKRLGKNQKIIVEDALAHVKDIEAQVEPRQETTGNLEIGDKFTTITPEGKLDDVVVTKDEGGVKTLKDGISYKVDSTFDTVPVVGEVQKPIPTPAERGELPTRAESVGPAVPETRPERIFETQPFERATVADPSTPQGKIEREMRQADVMQPEVEAQAMVEGRRPLEEALVFEEPTGPLSFMKNFAARMKNAKDRNDVLDSFTESFVDDLVRLQRNILDASPEGMRDFREMPTDHNFYKLARLTRGNVGRGNAFLKQPYDLRHSSPKEGVRGFNDIVRDARKLGDLNDFATYGAAKRAIELEKRGIKSGITKHTAERYVKANEAKYEQLFQDWKNFSSALLKETMVESGIITEAQFKKMQGLNRDYVPFQRHFEKNETPLNSLLRMKGSSRQVVNPLVSTMQQTYRMIETATRNEALRTFVDFNMERRTGVVEKAEGEVRKPESADLEAENIARDTAEQLGLERSQAEALKPDSSHPAKDVISIWRNGKRELYRVNDPLLAEALKMKRGGYQQAGLGKVGAVFGAPTRIFRTGVTGPLKFAFRNLMRDPMAQAVLTRQGWTVPYYRMIRGALHTLGRTETYEKFRRSGAEHSMLASLDRGRMEKELGEVGRSPAMQAFKIISPNEMFGMRPFGELFEKATRVGEFEAAMKRTGDPRYAGMEARDITVDFGKAGLEGRIMNQFISFFNPGIQGLTRTGQSIRESLTPEAWKTRPGLARNAMMKGFTMLTLPTLALYDLNKDNPIYQELPDEAKRNYWVIFPERMTTDQWSQMDGDARVTWLQENQPIAIAKPHELGHIFGTMWEETADWLSGNDPEGYKRLMETAHTTVVRDLWPTTVKPVVEHLSNHSFFTGRNLVGKRYERGLPQDQYTPYTTEVAKDFASGLAQVGVEISPIVLENYARGWLGTVATDTMRLADLVMDDEQIKPEDATIRRMFDPTLLRVPSGSASSINKFYNNIDEARSHLESIDTAKTQGDVDEYEFRNNRSREDGYSPEVVGVLDEGSKAISERLRQIYSLTVDPRHDLTPKEKTREIQKRYLDMADIARLYNKRLRQMRRAVKEQPL